MATVFAAYPANKNPDLWAKWGNALYLSVSGVLFTSSVMMIVVFIFTGRLRWVKAVLSFELMTPFAKLMYGVYLSSPLIMVAFYVSLEKSPVLQTKGLIAFSAGFLAAGLGFACVLFFLVDAPVGHQLKDLLKTRWIP